MDLNLSLFTVARLLLSETEPDRAAEQLLRHVREITEADRGFIVVREGDRFVQKFDVNFDRSSLEPEERRFSRSIVKAAIDARQVIETENPSTDPRFASADSVAALEQRSVRAAPLEHGGDVVGVIYLDRRERLAPVVTGFLREVGALAGAAIQRALDQEALRRRNEELEHDLFARYELKDIVTRSGNMLALLRLVGQVADSDASVLIRGETGTGKELIARALHVNSARRRKPFVVVHCAALPEALLESELFGHRRGAFTGAERDRTGRFAQAAGGTLFLDEIAEVPPQVQAKLLRFLQFGELSRLGSDSVETVDVRVVAATHADLGRMVKDKTFRQDLYYRLKVVEVAVPPLRERAADVLLLGDLFLQRMWRRTGERPRLTTRAERVLAAHDYPGNVRELEHIIERACLLARGPEVDVDALPPELTGGGEAAAAAPPPSRFTRYQLDELAAARDVAVQALEAEFVKGLLERHGGNVSLAARESGMNRTYLQRLLARYR